MVNQICDNALLTGYVEEAQAIDERIIQEVINDSPIFQLISSKKKIFHHDGGDVNSIVNE
ncbi:MAG: hypothetical protein JNN05_08995 [Candidatus Omnitrophica bacterium]|nr:hypothetical protein [Candidatus Omnitrophota bacterium]